MKLPTEGTIDHARGNIGVIKKCCNVVFGYALRNEGLYNQKTFLSSPRSGIEYKNSRMANARSSQSATGAPFIYTYRERERERECVCVCRELLTDS